MLSQWHTDHRPTFHCSLSGIFSLRVPTHHTVSVKSHLKVNKIQRRFSQDRDISTHNTEAGGRAGVCSQCAWLVKGRSFHLGLICVDASSIVQVQRCLLYWKWCGQVFLSPVPKVNTSVCFFPFLLCSSKMAVLCLAQMNTEFVSKLLRRQLSAPSKNHSQQAPVKHSRAIRC